MSEIDVRVATADDVRAVAARLDADELTFRIAMQCAEDKTAWSVRDGEEAIALCVARDTEDERLVGALYVEPSYRGDGIGSALIDAAFAECGDRARAFAFVAGDDSATALALRRGLRLASPLLQLSGAVPREDALMAMAAGSYHFDVDTIDVRRHGAFLSALDREVRGTSRYADHERYAAAASGQAFLLDGDMVAYAYCWPDGRIGPMAVSSASYAVQILAFVLVTLQRTYGASWCTALVPGSNVRIARALLRGGLTIGARNGYATDGTETVELSRYVAYDALAV